LVVCLLADFWKKRAVVDSKNNFLRPVLVGNSANNLWVSSVFVTLILVKALCDIAKRLNYR
jgi:hypothetical protein